MTSCMCVREEEHKNLNSQALALHVRTLTCVLATVCDWLNAHLNVYFIE